MEFSTIFATTIQEGNFPPDNEPSPSLPPETSRVGTTPPSNPPPATSTPSPPQPSSTPSGGQNGNTSPQIVNSSPSNPGSATGAGGGAGAASTPTPSSASTESPPSTNFPNTQTSSAPSSLSGNSLSSSPPLSPSTSSTHISAPSSSSSPHAQSSHPHPVDLATILEIVLSCALAALLIVSAAIYWRRTRHRRKKSPRDYGITPITFENPRDHESTDAPLKNSNAPEADDDIVPAISHLEREEKKPELLLAKSEALLPNDHARSPSPSVQVDRIADKRVFRLLAERQSTRWQENTVSANATSPGAVIDEELPRYTRRAGGG